MLAKIQKWGNSLGVRLPKQLTRSINLNAGAYVDITSFNNSLIIKINDDPLDALLNRVTEQNSHPIIFNDTDKRGKESW